jgi:hypothetical protein
LDRCRLPAALQLDFDFVDHQFTARHSDSRTQIVRLTPMAVAAFYREVLAVLTALGIRVAINPGTAEIAQPERLDQNETHDAYDPHAANRWHRIVLATTLVLQRFRTPFGGKSSPINFFWGGFDLSHARFSGRSASPPASWPRFLRLRDDQENYSYGFWPGNTTSAGLTLGEPAFYAYCYPEPPGFRDAVVLPSGAFYHPDFGEFLLPYDVMRRSARPDATLLAFFEGTYVAAATTGKWDRTALERPEFAQIG